LCSTGVSVDKGPDGVELSCIIALELNLLEQVTKLPDTADWFCYHHRIGAKRSMFVENGRKETSEKSGEPGTTILLEGLKVLV
jgi:hypothetical protein